jgi:hypothetical protein
MRGEEWILSPPRLVGTCRHLKMRMILLAGVLRMQMRRRR